MNKRIVIPLPLVLLAPLATVVLPLTAAAGAKGHWASGWGSLKLPAFARTAAALSR